MNAPVHSLAPPEAAALARAIELAGLGVGAVEPNPPVGAVLLQRERRVGEGFHREWGSLHAEAEALAVAGDAARGATLVVTLEPCSARGGAKKQPPCVEALRAAGVSRVVVGALDPDPRHAGAGLAQLKASGIDVALVDSPESKALIARFAAHLGRARPFVFLKWAEGQDGGWQNADPTVRWISGDAARAKGHELRARVDAILVGSGTVLRDDPQLTARPPGPRPLVRVVVDGRARVPASARCFVDGAAPTWWVTETHARPAASVPAGVLHLPLHDPHDLDGELLPALHQRGVRRLLVEGGPNVAAAFLAARVVDRAWIFVAPRDAGALVPMLPPLPPPTAARLSPCGADLWYQFDFS